MRAVGRGIPVLNEEGILVTGSEERSWVSDSKSTSEVDFPTLLLNMNSFLWLTFSLTQSSGVFLYFVIVYQHKNPWIYVKIAKLNGENGNKGKDITPIKFMWSTFFRALLYWSSYNGVLNSYTIPNDQTWFNVNASCGMQFDLAQMDLFRGTSRDKHFYHVEHVV